MEIDDGAHAQLANPAAEGQEIAPAAALGHGDDVVHPGDQPGDLLEALFHHIMQARAREALLEQGDRGDGEHDIAEKAQAHEEHVACERIVQVPGQVQPPAQIITGPDRSVYSDYTRRGRRS